MKWLLAGLFIFVLLAVYVNAQVLADLSGKQTRADAHRAQLRARIDTLEWGLAQMCIEMESRRGQ